MFCGHQPEALSVTLHSLGCCIYEGLSTYRASVALTSAGSCSFCSATNNSSGTIETGRGRKTGEEKKTDSKIRLVLTSVPLPGQLTYLQLALVNR